MFVPVAIASALTGTHRDCLADGSFFLDQEPEIQSET